MHLPALDHWTNTRIGLHQAAQVLGAIQAAAAEPEPNYLHLALRIIPNGLTTHTLPKGDLQLDFVDQCIRYRSPENRETCIPLAQHTPISLADQIEYQLSPLTLKREKLTATQPFQIDPRLATDYAHALTLISSALERFRAGLPKEKTPLVVWPHGFDLSFLWFATERLDEQAPHLSFGFSPYSAGLERPYLYAYAYPIPDGLTQTQLPPLAHWHTQDWTGAVLPYDTLVKLDEPEQAIVSSFQQIYDSVAPLLS
ncbi:MAG TPA: DUF5996 family protein [Aggregatilineaceae bacterium]|nr:DUF5996 family protein [Aggregatilineaceae bacterium]